MPNGDGDQARGHVAHRGQGLQQAERIGPRAIGQRIGNQGDRQSENAPNPQSGYEPVDGKIDDAARERGQPGAQGVEQHHER